MGDTDLNWVNVELAEHGHYRTLAGLFDSGSVHALVSGETFCRKSTDGIGTFVGTVGGKPFGVIACDFRVDGGTFGKENSERVRQFIGAMQREHAPIYFQFHTMGVRFVEGRTIFQNAFRLIPTLATFAEKNLLITSVHGNCLGLGAILFGLGHYQFAITQKSFNLTGPEVFKMFFGTKVDYQSATSVDRAAKNTELVHEIVEAPEAVYHKIRALMGATHLPPATLSDAEKALLEATGTDVVEVFASPHASVRCFIANRGGHKVGVLMTPPGRPNLITVPSLQKYRAAMKLFAHLKLPVVSFLDTAGADPRVEQSDKNMVGELIEFAKTVVGYRHGLMGVIVGRAFGGATIIGFPKSFGSDRVVVVEGAKMGVMDSKIITQLLSGSPRLSAQWQETMATQTEDLQDMLDAGIVDAKIQKADISTEIGNFIDERNNPRSVIPLTLPTRTVRHAPTVPVLRDARLENS